MKLRTYLLIISIVFIIIGITIKYNSYYKKYNIEKKELKKIVNFLEYKKHNIEYIAVLEIPKINLKKGLKINTKVDEGIEIIDYNKFINNDIILASHSGNCDVCYFNKIDELSINDEIYIYKEDIKYIYKIKHIEEKKKNTFKLDDSIDSITLITCKKNTDNIQIVIKANLLTQEKY